MNKPQKLVKILELWDIVRTKYFPEIDPTSGFIHANRFLLDHNSSYFLPYSRCGELYSSLTITPEGGICECNGTFIEHFDQYKQELLKDGELKKYQLAKVRDKIYYNPAEMSDAEIYEHD